MTWTILIALPLIALVALFAIRPLRRAIQRFIEDPLADFVLGRNIEPGSTILVNRDPENEDEVDITIIPGAPPVEAEKVTVPPEEPKAEDGEGDQPSDDS